MSHNSNIAEFGTLCPHRAVGTSGKENSMARKRYQNGRVFLKGKKEEKWVGRYREDVVDVTGTTRRVRRSVILGTKRELPTKRLAERRLATILARINCLDYRPGRAATFGEFIERWETEVLTTQKPSSARAVRSHLRCYIIPEVGKLRLDEFGVENQQRFITRMPERSTDKVVSRKTILNVIATISTILATARNWGYSCEQIDMKKLRLPPRGVASEARHFTIEQVQRILALAGEPWRTLFCICTLDGLRAGEALGLQWGDIDLEQRILQIRRTAWYGKTQTPEEPGKRDNTSHSRRFGDDSEKLPQRVETESRWIPVRHQKPTTTLIQQRRGAPPLADSRRARDSTVRPPRISSHSHGAIA